MSKSSLKLPPPLTEEVTVEHIDEHFDLLCAETERHYELSYAGMSFDEVEEHTRKSAIFRGIVTLIIRGNAKIEHGKVLFWNPFDGGFEEYGKELDTKYKMVLSSFYALTKGPEKKDKGFLSVEHKH